jgi:hypothetical protein
LCVEIWIQRAVIIWSKNITSHSKMSSRKHCAFYCIFLSKRT